MAKHTKRKTRKTLHPMVIALLFVIVGTIMYLMAKTMPKAPESGGDAPFRPVVGDPPYRVAIDAGHGGDDPGASGVVLEKDMTAATAAELLAWLEADSNFIPLQTRESYDTTAKPSERAESVNAQSAQLLLSVHGNSAAEGTNAAGFECYPSVPGRIWHRESVYFAELLADGMQKAGAKLRGKGGVRYIYYTASGEKQLVEANHTETRHERSFTLLEDSNCPAVLAEQCFVTSEADVDAFGDADGCVRVARIYYEAICAYFGTTPISAK